MKRPRHIIESFLLAIIFFVMLFGSVPPAHPLDPVSVDDIEAAMRTLDFLESLPSGGGPIVVGVIYPADIPAMEPVAEATARIIGTIRGPNSRALQPVVLSTANLAQTQDHLDVIFLLPGAARHSDVLLGAMRRHHLVSISDDPLCKQTNCCVLLVRTGQQVDISLDSALADAVGARFSLVFTMVVRRK